VLLWLLCVGVVVMVAVELVIRSSSPASLFVEMVYFQDEHIQTL
jgi:hypothetical protein